MPYFSIIIPVYNRPDEVNDLLESLSKQTYKDFEVIIVEDGSTVCCADAVKRYASIVDIHYYYKENEGRSIARNYGLERAVGSYFIFFDSDCVIPEGYFEALNAVLNRHYTDCFGGPDAAHDSFSDVQKAINYSMTSFLTTGGIRGGKVQLEKFTPRTFNMGFSREVYDRVGGFREMFSEAFVRPGSIYLLSAMRLSIINEELVCVCFSDRFISSACRAFPFIYSILIR